MLDELEQAAQQLAAKVSYESLAASVGYGGLCRVKGEYRIIVDKRATPRERVSALAQAISGLDYSKLTLSPKVREVVQFYATAKQRARAAI